MSQKRKKSPVKKVPPSEDIIREIALYKIRQNSTISDEVDFNPDAKVVHPETEDEGYWVEAWVYVRKDEIDDEERKGYYREE